MIYFLYFVKYIINLLFLALVFYEYLKINLNYQHLQEKVKEYFLIFDIFIASIFGFLIIPDLVIGFFFFPSIFKFLYFSLLVSANYILYKFVIHKKNLNYLPPLSTLKTLSILDIINIFAKPTFKEFLIAIALSYFQIVLFSKIYTLYN